MRTDVSKLLSRCLLLKVSVSADKSKLTTKNALDLSDGSGDADESLRFQDWRRLIYYGCALRIFTDSA